jgi:hypothetical protein
VKKGALAEELSFKEKKFWFCLVVVGRRVVPKVVDRDRDA